MLPRNTVEGKDDSIALDRLMPAHMPAATTFKTSVAARDLTNDNRYAVVLSYPEQRVT